MRYAILAVLFIIAVFSFFVGYAVSSLLIGTVGDALAGPAERLGSAELDAELSLIPFGFGIICAISMCLIFLVFFLEQ